MKFSKTRPLLVLLLTALASTAHATIPPKDKQRFRNLSPRFELPAGVRFSPADEAKPYQELSATRTYGFVWKTYVQSTRRGVVCGEVNPWGLVFGGKFYLQDFIDSDGNIRDKDDAITLRLSSENIALIEQLSNSAREQFEKAFKKVPLVTGQTIVCARKGLFSDRVIYVESIATQDQAWTDTVEARAAHEAEKQRRKAEGSWTIGDVLAEAHHTAAETPDYEDMRILSRMGFWLRR